MPLPRSVFFLGCSLLTFTIAAACGGESSDDPAATPDAATTGDSASADATGDSAAPKNDAAGPIADGATQGDAALTAQETLICDALASRSACAGGAVACDSDKKCIYGKVMLPAAASVYATCRAAPSCKGDDACVSEAGQAVGGAAATTYVTDCAARRVACANAFDDEFCLASLFAYPGSGSGAQGCLGQPCDQVETCLMGLQAVKDIEACK